MRREAVVTFLIGLGAGVAIAWLLEAILVGRGVVSTYLAPVAFVAPVVAVLLRHK